MTTLSPIGKFITFCSTVSKYNGQIRTAAAIQIHCRKLMTRVFLPRLCFGALFSLNQDPSGPNGLDCQNKCKAQVLLHNTLVEDHINLLLFLTTWYVDVHWPCLSTHPDMEGRNAVCVFRKSAVSWRHRSLKKPLKEKQSLVDDAFVTGGFGVGY